MLELKSDVTHPLVSIITVTLNSEKTIRDTIESVVNQTYKNIEYIIIDGCSSDKTLEIVNEYKGFISKIISEPDSGIYDAMNKGVALSKGEIIGIINSDDYYLPDSIQKVVEYSIQNPKIDVFHGNITKMDFLNGTEYVSKPCLNFEELKYKNIIRHPATFVRKETYERFGLFSKKYRIAGDRELMLRIYTHGGAFYYIDDIFAVMYTGGVSSANKLLTLKEDRDLSLKYGAKPLKVILNWLSLSCKFRLRKYLYMLGFKSFFETRQSKRLKR